MNATNIRKIMLPEGHVVMSLCGDRVLLTVHSWVDFIPHVLTVAQAREIAESLSEYIVAADQAAAALVAHAQSAEVRS